MTTLTSSPPVIADINSPHAATVRLEKIAEALGVFKFIHLPLVRTALYQCALAVGKLLAEKDNGSIDHTVWSGVQVELQAVYEAVRKCLRYNGDLCDFQTSQRFGVEDNDGEGGFLALAA